MNKQKMTRSNFGPYIYNVKSLLSELFSRIRSVIRFKNYSHGYVRGSLEFLHA
jgi:hypothetical protein